MTKFVALTALLLLASCAADYRPGVVSGSYPTMPQNASANAMPQPAGSLNR